jgi:hypothetical protein
VTGTAAFPEVVYRGNRIENVRADLRYAAERFPRLGHRPGRGRDGIRRGRNPASAGRAARRPVPGGLIRGRPRAAADEWRRRRPTVGAGARRCRRGGLLRRTRRDRGGGERIAARGLVPRGPRGDRPGPHPLRGGAVSRSGAGRRYLGRDGPDRRVRHARRRPGPAVPAARPEPGRRRPRGRPAGSRGGAHVRVGNGHGKSAGPAAGRERFPGPGTDLRGLSRRRRFRQPDRHTPSDHARRRRRGAPFPGLGPRFRQRHRPEHEGAAAGPGGAGTESRPVGPRASRFGGRRRVSSRRRRRRARHPPPGWGRRRPGRPRGRCGACHGARDGNDRGPAVRRRRGPAPDGIRRRGGGRGESALRLPERYRGPGKRAAALAVGRSDGGGHARFARPGVGHLRRTRCGPGTVAALRAGGESPWKARRPLPVP